MTNLAKLARIAKSFTKFVIPIKLLTYENYDSHICTRIGDDFHRLRTYCGHSASTYRVCSKNDS
jgi:hypothetical protein